MMTKSGLSEGVERLQGMVAIGLLLARRPGRSANRLLCGSMNCLMLLTRDCKTESCRHVYLP